MGNSRKTKAKPKTPRKLPDGSLAVAAPTRQTRRAGPAAPLMDVDLNVDTSPGSNLAQAIIQQRDSLSPPPGLPIHETPVSGLVEPTLASLTQTSIATSATGSTSTAVQSRVSGLSSTMTYEECMGEQTCHCRIAPV